MKGTLITGCVRHVYVLYSGNTEKKGKNTKIGTKFDETLNMITPYLLFCIVRGQK
jgi:hypothetical protein